MCRDELMDMDSVRLAYITTLSCKLVTLKNKEPVLDSKKLSSSQLNNLKWVIKILIVMVSLYSFLT